MKVLILLSFFLSIFSSSIFLLMTEKVRALCSYQAKMPHELSFSRGDVMMVHQRFFGCSWWEAELPNGETGFVPCNLVVSYLEGDEDLLESRDKRIGELERENEVMRRMVQEKYREIQDAKAATSTSTSSSTPSLAAPATEKGRNEEKETVFSTQRDQEKE